MAHGIWRVCITIFVALALASCGSSSHGSGSGDCNAACSHGLSVCPDQFHDQEKCKSGCASLTPGQIACVRTDSTCALLSSCIGEGPHVAGTGAPSDQCQSVCAHANQVCPDQFHDQAKCMTGCTTTMSPGQAACVAAETTCAAISACVGE